MSSKIRLCVIIFASLLSTIAAAGTTGSITGVIKDSERKEAVEGATVVVTTPGQAEQVTLSDDRGRFSFENLTPGIYLIKANFAGAENKKGDVKLEADKKVEVALDIQLSKAVAEQYTISATGSLIGATAKDSPIPLLVTDRIDLQKQGGPTLVEQIKSSPIAGPVLGDSNQFSAAAQYRPGVGTINLRALGPQRTLVLLNGKRFSPNALNPADTNMLPMAAIGRVEILKDGGATTYGSDAIAGVANFMTRKDLNGLELKTDYRLVPGSVGDVNASAAYGWIGNTSNVLLSAGYQMRGELNSTQRSWANQPYVVNPSGWSVLGNPGDWTILGPTGPIGFAVDANCEALGGSLGFSGNTPLCRFTYVPFDNLVEPTHQLQLYGEFNTKLGDKSKLHLEALYSLTSVRFSSSPGYPPTSGPNGPGSVNVYSVPASNPGFNDFLTQTGNGALIGTATRALATLWRPFANGGLPGMDGNGSRKFYSKNEEVRIAADMSGDLGGCDLGYQLGASYLIESQALQGYDILINRLQRALNGLGGPNCTGTTPGANGCEYFNPFSNALERNPALNLDNPGFVPGNENNAELVAWMTGSGQFRWRTDLAVVDALVDGSLPFNLPGGAPKWAVGGQYRKTSFLQYLDDDNLDARVTPCPTPGDTSCTVKTGPFMFLGQSKPQFLEQGVYALFGQLDIPTFDAWKSQFSLRFENYSGLTGSTLNPQFRTKWQMLDFWALRGSIGTSFRGPTAVNVSPTGVTQLAGIAAAGNNFKSVDVLGNPNLSPEKAFTFNVGTILQFKNLTATLDYWFYSLDNQITTIPANLIATAVGGVGNGTQFANCSSPLLGRVTFDNNNTCTQGVTAGNNIARVRSDTVNGPNVRTMGLDAELDYLWDGLFGGALNLGGVASVVIGYDQAEFVVDGVQIAPAYSAVGFTNYDRLPGTIPRWRGQFFVNYNHGWHNVRLTTNYIDGATDNRGPTTVQTGATGPITATTACTVANAAAGTAPNCQLTTFGNELKGFVSLDLSYRLSLPFDFVVTTSILNILNQAPPQARLEYSYDPSVGTPHGITFKFGLEKTF